MNLHPLEIQTLVLVAVVLFVAGSISLYVSPYPAFPWPFLVVVGGSDRCRHDGLLYVQSTVHDLLWRVQSGSPGGPSYT